MLVVCFSLGKFNFLPVKCLLNLFINDLEYGVNNEVAKLAGNTEQPFRIVKTNTGCENLKKRLSRLSERAMKWQ